MTADQLHVADAGDSIALIEAASGLQVTYDELHALIVRRQEQLESVSGQRVLLGLERSVRAVVDLHALLRVGAVVLAIDPASPTGRLAGWVAAYRPALGLHLQNGAVAVPPSDESDRGHAGREALMLATSGSTGSPKFVRLTRQNLEANATQIVQALDIRPEARAFGHLPLFYSFGLSVLNSHLSAGATVILTDESAVRPQFWSELQEREATSLSGVPYSFEIFERMGFAERASSLLTDLAQAGGWMPPERIRTFHRFMAARGGRLWVMYGQTEATARISVLPPDLLPDRAETVGKALPGSHVSIEDPDEHGIGEIVVNGPQVMLGYAESTQDIDGSDDCKGVLRTGDLGSVDSEGLIRISGRVKRIAKVFGARVSLDDVERQLSDLGPVAALQHGEGIALFVAGGSRATPGAREIERRVGLPPRSIRVTTIEEMPTTSSGKVDRSALENLTGSLSWT